LIVVAGIILYSEQLYSECGFVQLYRVYSECGFVQLYRVYSECGFVQLYRVWRNNSALAGLQNVDLYAQLMSPQNFVSTAIAADCPRRLDFRIARFIMNGIQYPAHALIHLLLPKLIKTLPFSL